MTIDPKTLSEFDVFLLTVIGESRGEPVEGQIAVSCTIRNRFHMNPKKYKTYIDVCLEPKQFSCWNFDDPNRGMLLDLAAKLINGQGLTDPVYRQIMLVVRGVMNWDIMDNTLSATNYMTKVLYDTNKPDWANKIRSSKIIGNQIFLTL